MPKGSPALPESSDRARVSPYPLRSSRTKKHKAKESIVQSEWEDKRCVICLEPPHNAVLLTCSSVLSGCRPYICGTGKRHSNCFKLFRKATKKKRLNAKTLHCPLCRGEVFETTKVTKPARRFMNAKPRSCTVENCEFSGTYCQLDNHLKTVHRGRIPPKVDPQRQARWEEMERHDENAQLMNAAGIQHVVEIVHHPLFNTHQDFQVAFVNGAVQHSFVPNYTATPWGNQVMYRATYTPAPMYGNPSISPPSVPPTNLASPTTPQPHSFYR